MYILLLLMFGVIPQSGYLMCQSVNEAESPKK